MNDQSVRIRQEIQQLKNNYDKIETIQTNTNKEQECSQFRVINTDGDQYYIVSPTVISEIKKEHLNKVFLYKEFLYANIGISEALAPVMELKFIKQLQEHKQFNNKTLGDVLNLLLDRKVEIIENAKKKTQRKGSGDYYFNEEEHNEMKIIAKALTNFQNFRHSLWKQKIDENRKPYTDTRLMDFLLKSYIGQISLLNDYTQGNNMLCKKGKKAKIEATGDIWISQDSLADILNKNNSLFKRITKKKIEKKIEEKYEQLPYGKWFKNHSKPNNNSISYKGEEKQCNLPPINNKKKLNYEEWFKNHNSNAKKLHKSIDTVDLIRGNLPEPVDNSEPEDGTESQYEGYEVVEL